MKGLATILTYLGSSVARIFSDKILSWIALKAILVFLCIVVMPILLNNFLYDLIEIVMNFANSQSASGSSLNGSMTFSGLLGWLIASFRLPECLSVLISALVLRVCLSMVPFVRLVG